MCAVFLAAAMSIGAVSSESDLDARVDRRTELMSVVFRLSGANEYNQIQSNWSYGKEVDEYFKQFAKHDAVVAAKELRERFDVSYNAPMSLAVHLVDTQNFKELISFDRKPAELDSRWRLRETRDFVKKLADFAKVSKFNEFADAHEGLYRLIEQRMKEFVSGGGYVKWFESYFGVRPHTEFVVIVSLLNGPCNYGTSVVFPDGREVICPVIGADSFDGDDKPVFNENHSGLLVHELCHAYTNPIVDRYAEQLAKPGKRIFRYCEETMASQAYSTWQTLMYESFVRAVVVRNLLATKGRMAAEVQAGRDADRGFVWVGDLAKLLAEYEKQRTKYKSFEDFVPEIVAFFEDYAVKYEAEAKSTLAKAPKIARMIPANGDQEVDPGLTKIEIEFDRTMMDGMWSFVGGGPTFPKRSGDVHYDTACKVITMPVELEPNKEYEFWLNRGNFTSFRSTEGGVLQSVHVTFRTRGE